MLATGLGISGYGTKKGEVKQDERAMEGARSLGKQVVQLIQILDKKFEKGKDQA